MFRNFYTIFVALSIVAAACGQLSLNVLGDSNDVPKSNPLIKIGALNGQISANILDGSKDDQQVDPLIKTDPSSDKRKMVLSHDQLMKPFTRVNNKYYYFGQSKVSWYKATLICRSLGGFLAAPETQQESEAISNYLVSKYPTDRWWWLSGSDLDSDGDFFWYKTGERMHYADWSAGQPDNWGRTEHCVHYWFTPVLNKYQMNDWVCNGQAYYICESDMAKLLPRKNCYF